MLVLGAEGHYHGRFPWLTGTLIIVNVVVFTAQAFIGEPLTNGYSLVPGEITSQQDLQGIKLNKASAGRKGKHRPPAVTRQSSGQVAQLTDGKALTDAFSLTPGAITSRQDLPASTPSPGNSGDLAGINDSASVRIKHYTGPYPIFLTLVTSMFMHDHLPALFGNTWYLLIFGLNIECALGHKRFLAFYIMCGICAGLAHVCSDPHSVVPSMGASGAISGILGAYIAIHPLNKVKIWAILGCIDVPALVVIGIWFILQFAATFFTVHDMGVKGANHWNHLAGFAAGFIIIRGAVYCLRLQKLTSTLTKKEPLESADEGRVVKPAADPFANFLPPPFVCDTAEEKGQHVGEELARQQPTRSGV